MKRKPVFFACLMLAASLSAQQGNVTSGNPVFPGWYADPEGIVFDDTYWIYPTVSMLHGEDTLTYRKEARRKTRAINPDYNQQTHIDAFSSKDLVHWTKHPSVQGRTGETAHLEVRQRGTAHRPVRIPRRRRTVLHVLRRVAPLQCRPAEG